MKTNYFSLQKTSIYSLFGILSLFFISCGSTQNTSYADSDGIYGSSSKTQAQSSDQYTPNNIEYKYYFKSLQKPGTKAADTTQTFVDVESYSSSDYQDYDSVAYPAWGTTTDNVSVNVYDSSWVWGFGWGLGWGYAGYGWGWGWGYPAYAWGYPGYGWGYPGYGWGYPGYGCGYPGYGYPAYGYNYAYANGTRGSLYGGSNNYYYNNRYGQNGRYYAQNSVPNYSTRGITSTRNPGYSAGNVRSANITNTRNYSTTSQGSNSSTRSNYSSGSTRSNSANYSSGGGRSYGGGSYGGGGGSYGGGGRSGGGGGGGRR